MRGYLLAGGAGDAGRGVEAGFGGFAAHLAGGFGEGDVDTEKISCKVVCVRRSRAESCVCACRGNAIRRRDDMKKLGTALLLLLSFALATPAQLADRQRGGGSHVRGQRRRST